MSRTPLQRLGIIALVAMIALTGISVPAQAVETGTIAGHFTNNGAPMAYVTVTARSVDWSQWAYAYTDNNGAYAITGLAPGNYLVSFRTQDGLEQYAFGKRDSNTADKIAVTAGTVSTVDDSLLPTGTFTGRFVGRDGLGIANAGVSFQPYRGSGYASGTTVSDGTYSVRLFPGQYLVSFSVREGWQTLLTQYVPGKLSYSQAQVFTIGAGETVTVNETVLPTGRISGRFTNTDGTTGMRVMVGLRDPNVAEGWTQSAYADADGNYVFPMAPAGSWRVYFSHWDPKVSQFATGKANPAQADLFTVAEGQSIVVNDSKLPVGKVRAVSKDAVTGAVIRAFDVNLEYAGYGHTDGGVEAIATEVPVGTHAYTINAYGFHSASGTVTVAEGGQAEIEVSLRRKSRIDLTIVDSATGQPVSGVCAVVAELQRVNNPDGCWPVTGADGKVIVETPGAGVFQLWAYPTEAPGYGAQWVGWNGGTGTQVSARPINVEKDQAAEGIVVKMDRAGTITGKVTRSDGSVAAQSVVSFLNIEPHVGGGVGLAHVDDEGRYTVDFLGPYEWPLMFGGGQFSGNTGNRHLAQKINVTAGATTTYDFRFKAEVTLTVKFKNPPTGEDGCYAYVYNAVTGDHLGYSWNKDCAAGVQIGVVGPQAVKVRYLIDPNQWPPKWHGGNDFAHATVVLIPNSGNKTITVG